MVRAWVLITAATNRSIDMDMLIHHEDYLPDCTEYVIAELPPLIVDDDEFEAAFFEALARTKARLYALQAA